MRAGLTPLLAVLALALAACAGPPGVFRSDRNDPLLTAPPLTEPIAAGIYVAPVPGVEAEPFRRAVAEALTARKVAAGVDSVGALGAVLSATPGEPTAAGQGYVNVIWRLERADGVLMDTFQAPTPLDFRVERPETQAIINAMADRLAAKLGPRESPAEPVRILVAVPPAATEGFEDGGPLARAMATALAARGFQPSAAGEAAATVRAHARATPAAGAPNMAEITIRWAVVDQRGVEVGAADQKNAVPKVLVEDGLAAIAADAAAAAVDSVAGLVRLAAKPRQATTASTASGAS